MDSETEFPVPNRAQSELIKEYFETESQFIATSSFYGIFQNIILRKHAVSMIAQVSKRIDSDAYIPYLAVNYFDRLCSRNKDILKDKEVEGRNNAERLRVVAMGCLTISAKMRTNNFSIDQLLSAMKSMKGDITRPMIKKVEYLILDVLNWKMLPVTAFCFLNHYYPYFKKFGGFRRRCINEIIVQAQGEHTVIRYTPSQIALSAFLAASKIAYPLKYDKILNPSNFHKIDNEEMVKKCVDHMIDLCSRMNINIEPAESEIGSPCSKVIVVVNSREEKEKEDETVIINGVGNSTVKEIQQDNGKAAVVPSSEGKKKENGTTIINGVGNSKVKEIQQGNGKEAVVGSGEGKEKENGTAIINGIGTSKAMVIQPSKSKAVVLNLCKEDEDEEVGTALIQRRQVMRNTDSSQGKVRMQVDVIQIPMDDKDRIEAIIRRSLEKRNEIEPRIQRRGSSLGIIDLVEPLNFKLKWFVDAQE